MLTICLVCQYMNQHSQVVLLLFMVEWTSYDFNRALLGTATEILMMKRFSSSTRRQSISNVISATRNCIRAQD